MGGDGDRSAITRIVDYLGWNPALLAAVAASLSSLTQGQGLAELPSWSAVAIDLYTNLRGMVAGIFGMSDAPVWQQDAAVAGLGVIALLARWFVGFFWSIAAFIAIAVGGYYALQYLLA